MSETSTAAAAGQSIPAVRSLRRRLWQALKDEDAVTAIRAYTCSKADFDKWLAEEAAEEAQRLERLEEARLREKLEKREARPAALKKLGSLVSITKRGNAAGLSNSMGQRRNPATRKTTPTTTNSVLPTRDSGVEMPKDKMAAQEKYSLLQIHLNPSEAFLPDDQKSPYASYNDEPNPILVVPSTTPRRQRRKTLVPRLAGFFGRNGNRRGEPGSDHGSDDGSDKNGVDETMTTPLHEACRIGCTALVGLMLANGGDPNFKNGKFRTALHMAAGGLTVAEEMLLVTASSKGQKEQARNAPEAESIGIRVPVTMNHDESNLEQHRQQSGLGATRAARAMGRFFKETLTSLGPSTRDRLSLSHSETQSSEKVDINLITKLQTDRMETVTTILVWTHPDDGTREAGDGPSINSVDCRGRTALHYAAELGRTSVCMAVLSTFGAILTIIDDRSQTPCELAAEYSHKILAAQLEARALLFADPYEMEDEFMSAGFDYDNDQGANSGGGHSRMTLVPPFSWFETLTAEQVDKERSARISRIMNALREAISDYNEAKDFRALMYSHTSDDDDSVDGIKAHLSGKAHALTLDNNSNAEEARAASFPIAYDDKKPSGEAVAKVDDQVQKVSARGSSHERGARVVSEETFKEIHAEIFLAFHSWNIEKCLNAIDDGPAKALLEASIQLPSPPGKKHHSEGRTCLICCEEFDDNPSKWRNLENCEHGFCVDCLGDYLKDCAVSRLGLLVVCPHHECSVHLSKNEIEELAPEPEVYTVLLSAASDNFVAAADDLKFCPHPGCTCVVKRIVPDLVKTAGIEDDIVDYAGAVCTTIRNTETGNAGVALTYEGVPDPDYSKSAGAIAPKKAHRFCFACSEQYVHWPVPCEALKTWEKKIEEEVGAVDAGEQSGNDKFDDLAQRLWMKANTRPCPKCKAPIEKNDGCNHMICSNPHCKHEFCWICRKDWKLHNTETGGFFRCNRWQGEDDHEFYDTPPPAEDRAPVPLTFELLSGDEDQARYGTAAHSARVAWKKSKEMARFLHHYTRWNAHSDSLKLERNMEKSVCARMAPVVKAAFEYTGDQNFNFRGKGLSFVYSAFTELLECRSILQHSYAFAFFRYPINFRRTRQSISRGREKGMFEQLQSELEMMTEQLSDIVARTHLRATQNQITFLTTETAEKRRDFSNLMLSILNDERKEQRRKAEKGDEDKIKRETESPMMSSWLHTDISQIARYGYDDETPTQRALRTTLRDFLNHRDEDIGYHGGGGGGGDDDYETFRWTNWSCTACTYMNSGGTRCAMCGSLRLR